MKSESGDLLSVLVAGEHNVDVLTDGHALSSAAQAVLRHAQAGGADVLVAASPFAERIVGATLMLAPDTLRGLRSEESVSADDVVLVIDVNLASGTNMATTARQVRRQGAQRVLGAVMHFLSDNVPSARDCGLDLLSLFGSPVPADHPS
jgi:NAD(P)-dependent dehydrogenase (short-subunit alcohol dehydrogenase family)